MKSKGNINKKLNNSIYKPKDFAEMLNVTVATLQRWDREDILKAFRSPTDRRYYTHEQYLEYIGNSNNKVVSFTVVSQEQEELLIKFATDNDIMKV